jgi:hypothetical protein
MIDVAVVLGAIRRGDLVVTSDHRDLALIADALGVEFLAFRWGRNWLPGANTGVRNNV